MKNKFKLAVIDYHYCDYLRQFDNKVYYNEGIKALRPFVGVLFSIDTIEYFAPLSSPKPKHIGMRSNLDIIKIYGGKLGVVNLNNMIPVTKNNYEIFSLNPIGKPIEVQKRIYLLKKQLYWLNGRANELMEKAFELHFRYCENVLPKPLKDRCCNYPLLEEKCLEYNKELIK